MLGDESSATSLAELQGVVAVALAPRITAGKSLTSTRRNGQHLNSISGDDADMSFPSQIRLDEDPHEWTNAIYCRGMDPEQK
jgi:hypothetical protein